MPHSIKRREDGSVDGVTWSGNPYTDGISAMVEATRGQEAWERKNFLGFTFEEIEESYGSGFVIDVAELESLVEARKLYEAYKRKQEEAWDNQNPGENPTMFGARHK